MNQILTYKEITEIYEGAMIYEGAVIREGAVICEGAVIREGAEICEGAMIYEGAEICEGAMIRPGAVICEGAVIREGAIIREVAMIRPGAMIYEGAVICEGAIIRGGAMIRKGYEGIVIHNAYKYSAGVYYDFNVNEVIIRLGCHHRTIDGWESDFNNNIKEFPIGSEELEKRIYVYNILKDFANKYLQIKEQTNEQD